MTYLHGKISANYTVINEKLLSPYDKSCRNYILFLTNVERARDVLGPQISNRVVLVSRSTQWKLQEFLSSKESSDIVNLLVVGESLTADETKVALSMGPEKIESFHFDSVLGAAVRSVHSSAVHRRAWLEQAISPDFLDQGEIVSAERSSVSAEVFEGLCRPPIHRDSDSPAAVRNQAAVD